MGSPGMPCGPSYLVSEQETILCYAESRLESSRVTAKSLKVTSTVTNYLLKLTDPTQRTDSSQVPNGE